LELYAGFLGMEIWMVAIYCIGLGKIKGEGRERRENPNIYGISKLMNLDQENMGVHCSILSISLCLKLSVIKSWGKAGDEVIECLPRIHEALVPSPATHTHTHTWGEGEKKLETWYIWFKRTY
jgi:hypothetical protein